MPRIEETTAAEFIHRFQAGEIPPDTKVKVTWEKTDTVSDPVGVPPTLRDVLGYEPQRAATMEELEADRAGFDEFYANLNETRRELGMGTI